MISPELSLCECGCGQRVRSPDSKFVRGHQARSVEWKESVGALRRKGEERTCLRPGCGNTFWVPDCLDEQHKYCDEYCASIMAHRNLLPRNRLQIRLLEYVARHRLSLSAFCKLAGLKQPRVSAWFKHKDRLLFRDALEALASVLGISVEQAIREANGTADERMLQVGSQTAAQNFPKKGTKQASENARRGGSANKGKTQSP